MTPMNETQRNPALLSPPALAFVGDAVFELLAREYLTAQGNRPAGELHRLAVEMVRASAQSDAAERLLPLLSEREEAIYRRGRNSNAVHPPKNSSPSDYRRATGLEALFGWLYLSGDTARINELFGVILAAPQEE